MNPALHVLSAFADEPSLISATPNYPVAWVILTVTLLYVAGFLFGLSVGKLNRRLLAERLEMANWHLERLRRERSVRPPDQPGVDEPGEFTGRTADWWKEK